MEAEIPMVLLERDALTGLYYVTATDGTLDPDQGASEPYRFESVAEEAAKKIARETGASLEYRL